MPKQSNVTRAVHTLDAKGVVLGRLATQAALLLRGKHKPTFELNEDCGDYVEVVNAKDLKVTGNKLEGKIYYRHTGYPGGLRSYTLRTLMGKTPEKAIEKAVYGMLPKNRLRARWMKRLNVYRGVKT